MSGDVVRASQASSSSTTPRSRLDALSREELIFFVKKQVENLKLTKSENARLNTEIASLAAALKDAESSLQSSRQNDLETINQLKNNNSALEEENVTLRETIKSLENQIIDVNGRLEKLQQDCTVVATESQTDFDSPRDEEEDSKKSYEKELSEMEKENEILHCTVNDLRSMLDDTTQQLSALKEKRNVENVFSLEIADYEKSVEKLQKELKQSKDGFEALNAELTETRRELEVVREEKVRISTNMNKMKAAIVKLKSELDDKKNVIDGLSKENEKCLEALEKVNTEREEEKLSLSAVIGGDEEKIRQLEDDVSSLSRQLMSLRAAKDSLQQQHDNLLQEHNTFKTRALYVLEQKKNDITRNTDDQVESLEKVIKSQRKTIEKLGQSQRLTQDELHAETERSTALANKLQDAEKKMNSMIEQHKKKLSEQRQQLESRLASEVKLNSELIAQIDANFEVHAKEKERLTKELLEEKETAALKIDELKRCLEQERKKLLETDHIKLHPNITVVPQQSPQPARINHPYSQRSPSVLESPISSSEEIASEGTLKEVIYGDDTPEYSVDAVENWGNFTEMINWEEVAKKTQKQLENIREILCESEAANARFLEQIKLLKEEIRRMERNGERIDHVSNTEYLKNIIMKFIAPEKVDSEREQLIPVLATMLKLSSEEVQLLNLVTQANPEAGTNKSSVWSSYLHRWSGLS